MIPTCKLGSRVNAVLGRVRGDLFFLLVSVIGSLLGRVNFHF
jgi:hypothetical protein